MKILILILLFSGFISCKKKVKKNEPLGPGATNSNTFNGSKQYDSSFKLTQINTEKNGSVLLISNLIGEDYDFIEYAICPANPQAGAISCDQAKKSPMVSAVPTQIIHDVPSGLQYVHIRSCRNGSEKKCSPYKTEVFENVEPATGDYSDLLKQGDRIFAELVDHCRELKSVIQEALKKDELSYQQKDQLQDFQTTLDSENCAYILTTSDIDYLEDIFPASNTGGGDGGGDGDGEQDPGQNAGGAGKSSIGMVLGLASVPIVTGAFGAFSIYKSRSLKPNSSRSTRIASWNFLRKRQSGAARPIPTNSQADWLNSANSTQANRVPGSAGLSPEQISVRNKKWKKVGYGSLAIAAATAVGLAVFAATDGLGLTSSSLDKIKADFKRIWDGIIKSRDELKLLDSKWAKANISERSPFSRARIQALADSKNEISVSEPFGFIIAANPGLMTVKNPNTYVSPSDFTNNAIATTVSHIASMNNIASLGEDFQKTMGVIINGDLTAYGQPWQWDLFHRFYYKGRGSSQQALQHRVFPGLGNRDYENNLGDCWGPWYSMFDSKSNWCAKNSLKVLEKELDRMTDLPINDFDINTGSYSMTYGPIHIVQLHNHPFYARPELKFHPAGKTQSALSWLKNNLQARPDKKVILNFHTPLSETDAAHNSERSEFLRLVSQSNVIGIFNGGSELRDNIGRSQQLSSAEGAIYTYNAGSANKNKFLYVHFTADKMTVYSIDSASGTPSIIASETKTTNLESLGKKPKIIDLRGEFPTAAHFGTSPGAKAVASYMEKNKCLSSAVVAKDGEIVAEVYSRSTKDTKEHLFSSTKSVVSILFGLMEKEGLIDLNDSLGGKGGVWDYADPDVEERESNRGLWRKIADYRYKLHIKINHLLSHTAGLKFQGGLQETTTIADLGFAGGISMIESLNRSKYVFPVEYHEQSTIDHISRCSEVTKKDIDTHLYVNPNNPQNRCRQWFYYWAGNIFSYIIKKQTRMTPKEYASEEFFPGLGIESPSPRWNRNFERIEYAFAGLYLTARQHLKIGQFMLQGGRISPDGSQLVKNDWVERATAKLVRNGENTWYGYQWYRQNGKRYYSSGLQGQIIGVNETKKTAASIFSHENCVQISNPNAIGVAGKLLALIDSAHFGPEPLVDTHERGTPYCKQLSDPDNYDHCSEDNENEDQRNEMLEKCAKSCSERYYEKLKIDY